MTDKEIKKAWETMKKELKKETGLESGFTMNAKQIKNRTATFLACNNIPYSEEIERLERDCARVQAYDTWTAEEKARHKEYTDGQIERYTKRMEKHGTKENELRNKHDMLVNSKAFKKFAANFDSVTTEFETKENMFYYIRFHY